MEIRKSLGLDDPIPVQLRGNFINAAAFKLGDLLSISPSRWRPC